METLRESMKDVQSALGKLHANPAADHSHPDPRANDSDDQDPGDQNQQGNSANNGDLQSLFMPQPRPVVTMGIDIASHVSPNTKAKIWRDEYIDLSQLLPQHVHNETYTLSFDPQSRQSGETKAAQLNA